MTFDDGSSASARRGFGALTVAIALIVGLAGGGILVWAMTRQPAPETEAEHTDVELPPGVVELSEESQKNGQVQLVAATTTTLPVTIDVTGVVAPDEARVAALRPLARGLVQRVLVRLGDRVEQGQALVVYDNIELGELVGAYLSERAALRQAEADRDVKRQALERAEQLIKLEAIAQQTLDLRRAEFRSAEAAVSSQTAKSAKVEEQLHRFGLSDKDLTALASGGGVHRESSQSTLRAPFPGIVTKYDVAVGELAEPDRELLTIANLSTVWVQGDLYEKDFAKVRPGVDVSVRVDAYPDRVFVGRLTYVGDIIDPTSRTAKIRCVVQNQDGALKLDMFAKLAVPTAGVRSAVLVPTAAVQTVDNQTVVFVAKEATRFERRDVQVGPAAGDMVEIVSGLTAGERLVGAGSFYLKTALLRERISDEH